MRKGRLLRMRSSAKKVNDASFQVLESSLAPSPTHKVPTRLPSERKEKSASRSMTCSTLPWRRWSRMRQGIKRRKLIIHLVSSSRRSYKWKPVMTSGNYRQGEDKDLLSAESTEKFCDPGFNSAYHNKDDCEILLNTGFSHKYQPKLLQDIVGQAMTIKAVSSAIAKKKIARLYLYHGPSGTGKTSTAKIFAMALNCESTLSSKPCWSCRGCSRSLYMTELCSGSKMAGFKRIKTLLQSTSFTQAIPGFKVLIIEECHSFTARAWDELLGIVEGTYGSTVVFVLITVDATMVPITIFSRCQKFCFTKLIDKDITLKLAGIVACENIAIEREALKLVITKAEGSLREAENILDQLALLGSTITTSMVQQLVGLAPHNKLADLLATAISGDTIKTIRFTRELTATGVEPRALLSQLASLITDILCGTGVADPSSSATPTSRDKRLLRSRSQFTNTQSHRLCNALKILVETEKQLRSSTDQTSSIVAALLEITALDVRSSISTGDKPNPSSEDIHWQILSHSRSTTDNHSIFKISDRLNIDRTEPATTTKGLYKNRKCRCIEVEKKPNSAPLSDMEEIWQNMLERVKSKSIKQLLCHQVKLASLTVSNANAIVHLMFERPEDKTAAQISEESISKALKRAIGCPVTVNMSLAPFDLVVCEENTFSTISPPVDCTHSKQPQRTPFAPELQPQRTPFAPEFVNSKTSEAATCSSTVHKPFRVSDKLRPRMIKDSTPSQEQYRFPPEEQEAATDKPPKTLHFLGLLSQKNQFDMSAYPERGTSTSEEHSRDTFHIVTANKPKHRWLSLSSIPQSDASVEPYSQDILFETTNRERETKARKKAAEVHNTQDIAMSHTWSCTDILCLGKAKERDNAK